MLKQCADSEEGFTSFTIFKRGFFLRTMKGAHRMSTLVAATVQQTSTTMTNSRIEKGKRTAPPTCHGHPAHAHVPAPSDCLRSHRSQSLGGWPPVRQWHLHVCICGALKLREGIKEGRSSSMRRTNFSPLRLGYMQRDKNNPHVHPSHQ